MTDEWRRPKLRDALHLAEAVRLVWHAAPGWTALNAVLAVLQGIVPLITVYLMKLIVDAVTQGASEQDHAAAFRTAAFYIVLAALVGLGAALLRSLASLTSEALGQIVTDHVSDIIHSKSIAVDLQYYEDPAYYDTLQRAQSEAPARPTKIVNDLLTTTQATISMVAMASLLFTLHWIVGVIVVVAAVPGALVRVRTSRLMYAWQRRRTETERQAWYAHWLLTAGDHAKEVRLFGLGELFRVAFRDLRTVLRKERIGIARRRALADFAAASVAVIATFATFALIAWQTIAGAISLGSMVMYYQAFQQGLTALQSVLQGLAGLYEDNLFLTYYHDFMQLEPHIVSPEHPAALPRPMRQGISFRGVDFSYPDSRRTALEGIDLTVRPGEVAALVGHNGSGKTTLVKLLCRLYDPTKGTVTLDGEDLRAYDVDELRRSMSVIFQDFAKYQSTARENIRMGNVDLPPDEEATTEAVAEAARRAGADQVITRLPKGYDTPLGRWFRDGEELSVGEWQKVALARAFIRDAQILVLDEPTSALDPVAEWNVFEHIRSLAEDRAVVLISHRFSTVRNADRIHILEAGSIVESGTHEELMALGGRYARMYEVQARAFSAEQQA